MSNLSAGVQILIDQLKENPDQFFGPLNQDNSRIPDYPKFHGWRQIIEDELVGIDYRSDRINKRLAHTWFLSEEEKAALADAFLLAKRQRFDAEIIMALTTEPQQDSVLRFNTANRYTTNLAQSMLQTKEAVTNTLLSGSASTTIGAENTVGAYHVR